MDYVIKNSDDGMILPDSDEVAKIIGNAEKFLNDIERLIKDKL